MKLGWLICFHVASRPLSLAQTNKQQLVKPARRGGLSALTASFNKFFLNLTHSLKTSLASSCLLISLSLLFQGMLFCNSGLIFFIECFSVLPFLLLLGFTLRAWRLLAFCVPCEKQVVSKCLVIRNLLRSPDGEEDASLT